MSHEIIMPVLGMNQNHGVIAKWHKQVGEEVTVGDVIMDVETDKAITEIEAKQDGYLIEVLYESGVDIPVGEVVARIASTKSDAIVETTSHDVLVQEEATLDDMVVSKKENKTSLLEQEPKITSFDSKYNSSDKVLASPKAKHLASQYGVNLADVAKTYHISPLHAHEVQSFIENRQEITSIPGVNFTRTQTAIDMTVNREEFDACLNHINEKAEYQDKNAGHLIAVLACSLIQKHDLMGIKTQAYHAQVNAWTGQVIQTTYLTLTKPMRFSALMPMTKSTEKNDLEVVCLIGSHIQSLQIGAVTSPLISVLEEDKQLKISLMGFEFDNVATGLHFAESLAQSIEHPLIHLL